MQLTPEQKAAFKADILANSALTNAVAQRLDDVIRDYYNAQAKPDFTVWRTSVTQDEIMQNGFDWVRVDNLSVGKARIWEWLFDNANRTINPSKANVRLGIDETWKGTQADLDVRAAVYVHCKRLVNRVERLFATGTGSNSTPGLAVVEGTVTTNEISALLN